MILHIMLRIQLVSWHIWELRQIFLIQIIVIHMTFLLICKQNVVLLLHIAINWADFAEIHLGRLNIFCNILVIFRVFRMFRHFDHTCITWILLR